MMSVLVRVAYTLMLYLKRREAVRLFTLGGSGGNSKSVGCLLRPISLSDYLCYGYCSVIGSGVGVAVG